MLSLFLTFFRVLWTLKSPSASIYRTSVVINLIYRHLATRKCHFMLAPIPTGMPTPMRRSYRTLQPISARVIPHYLTCLTNSSTPQDHWQSTNALKSTRTVFKAGKLVNQPRMVTRVLNRSIQRVLEISWLRNLWCYAFCPSRRIVCIPSSYHLNQTRCNLLTITPKDDVAP